MGRCKKNQVIVEQSDLVNALLCVPGKTEGWPMAKWKHRLIEALKEKSPEQFEILKKTATKLSH